uniref:Uncharacterized protein n=1 Tax=Arundo donax TaxID=35708 RepID=A0A0A9G1I7_ARUDO
MAMSMEQTRGTRTILTSYSSRFICRSEPR